MATVKKVSTANTSLSLFATAKKQPVTKAKKQREVVYVAKKDKQIKKFYKLKEVIDNATTELNEIKGELNQIGVDNFISLYEKQGRKPENFLLTSDCTEKLMFQVQDKYIKCTPEKAEYLEQLAPDLIETITSYSFNPDVFNKHQAAIDAAISQAVLSLKELSDDEKRSLFTVTEETRVVKGAVDRLAQFKNKKEVFAAIQPVVFFKNAE